MGQTFETTIGDLTAAVTVLDRDRVRELCAALVRQIHASEDPLPLATANAILNALRRRRFFHEVRCVADALARSGQDAPAVRLQYAQALIEEGALVAAAALLRELLAHPGADPAERAEARGLLGRVHKQAYVDARRDSVLAGTLARGASERAGTALRGAIRYYSEAYAEDPDSNYGHGIDAVACAERARRDGVEDDTIADPGRIARKILARIEARGDAADARALAAALEACIALDQPRAAAGWALDYAGHENHAGGPTADAFEIASTVRQLTEVWQLNDAHGLGKTLLPLLRRALLHRETGGVEVTPAQASPFGEAVRSARSNPPRARAGRELQRVFGADTVISLETYAKGLRRARTVARIGLEATGRGFGTGVLLWGRDLADRFGDRWLLLTNAHVLGTRADYPSVVSPDDAVISFEALPPGPGGALTAYGVRAVLWESGPSDLDAAIIELEGPVDGLAADDRCEVATSLPPNDQRGRVYIIGHLGGAGLSYSIQDNQLLDYESPRLHYRAPTGGGSSGSPIYNGQWKLIGLHHAGSHEMPRLRGESGTYEANEGIWIQAIRQALAASA